MELHNITVRMTEAMSVEAKRLADESRVPLVEWIRRCMCWGIDNPDWIRHNRCRETYRVPPRGRPDDQY